MSEKKKKILSRMPKPQGTLDKMSKPPENLGETPKPRGKSILRVAAAPFPVTSDPRRNWEIMESLCSEAAKAGARLVVFPEGALSGYYGEHFRDAAEIDLAEVARLNGRLGALARRTKACLVAGTLFEQDGRFFNSLVAVGPNGAGLARYDKRHLTGRDVKFYTPGGEPAVFQFAGHSIGLQICFDLRFPLWAHETARRGAEILVYSFNVCDQRGLWKREAMEAHLKSRAGENNVFVIGVNDARPNGNVASMIVDRQGRALARGYPRAPRLLVADLDFSVRNAIEREIVSGHRLDYPCAAQWKPQVQ